MSDIQGAPASSAGDDFHELWALRKVLQLLDPQSRVHAVVVEGTPSDERAAELGDGAQAVDVTEVGAGPTGETWVLEQLKYSTANPNRPWTWDRLTAERGRRRTGTSVIGKLARAFASVAGARTVRIVTNQPLAPKVAEDLTTWPAMLRAGQARPDPDLDRLRKACGLADCDLAHFLESFDISGFGSLTRLELESEILVRLGRLTDADARNDLDVLQQRIAGYILPENRHRSPIDRETLLSWLGVGDQDVLFPAPNEMVSAEPYVRRNMTSAVVEAIIETHDRIVRIHSEGGCGKTSLVCALPSELPAGSECVLYDCYGGGLYLTSDKRRHHPNQAFAQVINEIAGRIGSPFVMRRTNSIDVTASFRRRLEAAAELVSARDAKALLVIIFDAVDNARIAAGKRQEPCFLDELTSLSGWPKNVRLVVTARTGRLPTLGPPEVFHDVKIPGFDFEETTALVGHKRPSWSPDVVRDLHELSGGIPRRIAYALEGANQDGQTLAIGRLTPKQPGLDQLFVRRREEAAHRLGDAVALDRLLCALVHMPRPTPAHALAWVSDLDESYIADLATDLGGLTLRDEGWSFSDEDFEAFAEELTRDIAKPLIGRAADLLMTHRHSDAYAARSVAEILIQADRLESLYDLVLSAEAPACISDLAERRALQARRMGLAVNCARQARASTDANRLLVAAATGLKTDALVRKLLQSNIDLAAVLSPAEAFRVAVTEASGRPWRGRLRLALARREMIEAPEAARDHMRWWTAWVQDRNSAARERLDSITALDLAVEFEVTEALQGLDKAITGLRRWRPRSAVLAVVQQICVRAGAAGRAADLEAFLCRPRLPARVALSVADGLLRSGLPFSPAVGGLVIQAIGRMTSRDPFSNASRARRLLDLLEAAAEATPAAAVQSALDRHFPQRAIPSNRLSAALGAVDILARAASLRRHLTAVPHDLATWLPDPLPVPPVPDPLPRSRRRRPSPKREETRARDQARSINDRRTSLLERLTRVVELTDVFLDEAAEPATVLTALAKAIRSPSYPSDRNPAETYHQLARAWTWRLARRGALTPTALTNLRPDTWRAYLDWLESLSGIRGAASLVLEPLVDIAQQIEAASGGASSRSADLVACSRIAIAFDTELAKDFFQRALKLTERVDGEALAQLKATCAVAAGGVGGSRAARRDLAEALADVAGAVQATLGDEVDDYLPWDDVISACAAIDVTTALAAVGRWRDVGLIQPKGGLDDLAAADLPDPLARLLASLTNAYRLPPESSGEAEAMAGAALVGGDRDAVRKARDQLRELDHGMTNGWWSQQLHKTGAFLDTLEVDRVEAVANRSTEHSAEPIATLEDLEAILGAGPEGRTYPPPLAEVLARVKDPSLRVPILRRLVEVMPRSDGLGEFLIELLPSWIAYPPVKDWARTGLAAYIVNALPSLFRWDYDNTELLEACLALTGLDPAKQADLVLEAISFHTERMSPQLLFALVGVRGRLGSDEDRSLLIKDLIAHMRLGLDRPASVPILGAGAPEDLDLAMAGFLAALMGDVDKRVRWRAAHAAVQCSHRGPLVAELVASLNGEAALPFQASGLPVYRLACLQQLAAVFERIARQHPTRLAPHVPSLVQACLEGPPHALARELLKRTLLLVRSAGLGASVSDSDWALVSSVNVSPFPPLSRPRRDFHAEGLHRGRPLRERPLRFDFDEIDTLPYWYAPAGQVFGMGSYEIAQRAERWICDVWGFGPEAVRWAAEPRQSRFGDDRYGTTSHRHGSEPTLERLSRHLEWHALHCVMGELIAEQPTVEQYYGDGWADWMANRDFSTPNAWLADLRTPPPLEARFWRDPGFEPTDHDAWLGPLSERAFADELAAAGDGRLVVRGNFSLQASELLEQDVAVHSALVTSTSATTLARALQSIASHRDFLVPSAGDHSEINEPGHRLHGWLEESERDPRFDRADEARGEVSSLKISPGKAVGALGLERRSVLTRWSRDEACADELNLDWWGSGDGHDLTRGWRADASVHLLQDLLGATKRSLLLSVEITRRSGEGDDVERHTQWRIFVYHRNGTLEAFRPQRRDRGRFLVRKLRLGGVDILGRWLAHEIAELHALVDTTEGVARDRAQVKLMKTVEQLQRHRNGLRH